MKPQNVVLRYSILIFIFVSFSGVTFSQTTDSLSSRIEQKKIMISQELLEKPVTLDIVLTNTSQQDFVIYEFVNLWKPSQVPQEQIKFEYNYPGLWLSIYTFPGNDFKGQVVHTEAHTGEIMKGLTGGLFARLRSLRQIEERYGFSEIASDYWKKESTRRGRNSLPAGDSLFQELEVTLADYELEVGEYDLYINYVQNEEIYQFLPQHREEHIFKGSVQSNRVRLIVTE